MARTGELLKGFLDGLNHRLPGFRPIALVRLQQSACEGVFVSNHILSVKYLGDGREVLRAEYPKVVPVVPCNSRIQVRGLDAVGRLQKWFNYLS